MKATVLRRFRDKHTKAIYEAGDVIEVNKKRFTEMNATRFGVLVEEMKKEGGPPADEDDAGSPPKAATGEDDAGGPPNTAAGEE